MLLYTVNRIMTIGVYIGIAALLIATVGLSFLYSGTHIKNTVTIFQASEYLFALSLVFLIIGWIYEVKKSKARKI